MLGKETVLIVDDEWAMRNLIRIYLKESGFLTLEASNGNEAVSVLWNSEECHLVILDIMMPEKDGFETCESIRTITDVPILMLSARKDWQDRVEGLNLGADDYITKPFESEELIARIKALLRRAHLSSEGSNKKDLLFDDGLQIHFKNRTVNVNNKNVKLTVKEFNLLYKLASHPLRVFSREELVRLIWGEDFEGDQRTVDTHIKNIRSKLVAAGLTTNSIRTVWSVGYKFVFSP